MKPEMAQNRQMDSLLISAFEHFKGGRYPEAESICNRIVVSDPNNAQAFNLLASCCLKTGRLAKAIEYQEKALVISPDDRDILKNIELMYRKDGQHEKALAAVSKVISREPSSAVYRYCAAMSLCKLWRLQEAEEHLRTGIELDKNHINSYIMLGNVLQELGQYEEALEKFKIAYEIDSVNPHLLYNYGLLLLAMGDFERGFRFFEMRWKQGAQFALPSFVSGKEMWHGQEFFGKKLLVTMEQGHGDAIQFSRYVPEAAKLGGELIVRCKENLIDLLRPLAPEAKWIGFAEPVPAFDYYIPMMSFPLVMNTEVGNIPANIPYLHAHEKSVGDFSKAIPATGKKRIGVCWSGSKLHPKDHVRSIPPEYFEKIFANNKNMDFFIIQKGRDEDMAAALAKKYENVCDIGGKIDDFSDVAGVLANLDLLISCDTAIAHLAGAMGVAAWNLVQFNADWRWMIKREDSPWYPTMRLFRQSAMGDWESVIDSVAGELESGI